MLTYCDILVLERIPADRNHAGSYTTDYHAVNEEVAVAIRGKFRTIEDALQILLRLLLGIKRAQQTLQPM